MNFRKKKNLCQKGFTLIETLVGSSVFVLVAVASYQAFGVLMDAVNSSQAKVAATSVVNEKIEIIRNLPYVDVGIVGSIPAGKIGRSQTVTRDGYNFDITTTIRNVDDPFDGTIGGNSPDTSPADYKLVDLDVTCTNCKIFPPLKFTTLVAPFALETASNNGALFIQVIDSAGIPIPNANVTITNNQTTPNIVINEITDQNGVQIVDAPPGVNAYNIVATKNGYTTDQTYPIGGAAGPNPIIVDSTVVVQTVTSTTLIIDRFSTINVSTVDNACAPVPNVGFSLTGTKLIGTPSVLKYPTQNFTTNSSGTLTIPNIEWDNYDLSLTSLGFDIAGGPLLPDLSIPAGQTKELQLITVPHIEKSLLVTVIDGSGAMIDGATVRLQKTGFDQTKSTGEAGACPTPGQVFWNGLESGTYTLTVSKAGYQDDVSAFSMNSWQNKVITLTP